MKYRQPAIIVEITDVRAAWKNQLWAVNRFCRGRYRDQKIRHAESIMKKLEKIEQWVRDHIPPEEWSKYSND